jgi:hypothetical protein
VAWWQKYFAIKAKEFILNVLIDLNLGFGICKLTIRRKAAPVVHLLE